MSDKTVRRKKIIVGNWKMNPQTLPEAKELAAQVAKKTRGLRKIVAVVCPPFVFLSDVAKKIAKSPVKAGYQDVHFAESGSHTGFISPPMIKNLGASYVIVGHSERRKAGEDDELVNKKVQAALKAGIIPVVCVGESERNKQGDFLEFIKNQIKSAFLGVTKRQMMDVIIAYEPIWAIGAENAMQPRDVHQMTLYVRKILAEMYDRTTASLVPVLYGGAVNPLNAAHIMGEGQADGLLVGRASLSAKDFGEILDIANSVRW